ncbi:MAG: zinc-dependent alcohol dehydrogenase [Acidimicrobiales bacterium]
MASTMPAAVYQGRGIVSVEQLPVPTPGPGQVLVEVAYCGICGSDLHLLVEGWGEPGTVAGHEFSGSIVQVGGGVTTWKPGDVVVGGPPPRCGRCRRCRQRLPSQCETRSAIDSAHLGGAFARYVVLDTAALVRIPPNLTPRVAALAEPLAVALHGITRASLEADDRVMVFGTGPIGALAVAALVASQAHHVVAVEPNPARRELARRLGADEVLHPDELQSFPAWEPERLAEASVDAVIECSGKRAAMEMGLHQLRRGGRLVLVGTGMEQPTFDPNRMLLNELEVRGAFVYDEDGFDRALALLASGALATDVLIERDDVGLEALPQVLADLAGGTIAGKVLVTPGGAPGPVNS